MLRAAGCSTRALTSRRPALAGGSARNKQSARRSQYSYLANLRDAILPLAIPVGTIGIVVVGGMYMFGSPSAGRILFRVAIGIGMVLL